MHLTFLPLFYPNHQNKLKIINPKLKLVHLFVLAVRSSLSIESKGHGPCIAAHWFWGTYSIEGRGWDISSGLYATTVSDLAVHGFRCPNTVCSKWRAHPTIPITKGDTRSIDSLRHHLLEYYSYIVYHNIINYVVIM